MIAAIRLTAAATAAFQLLLFVSALGYPSEEVSRYAMAYVAATVVALAGVSLSADALVRLRRQRPAAGLGVALVLIAGALGMIVVGESSFGVLTYGPIVVVLTALLIPPG